MKYIATLLLITFTTTCILPPAFAQDKELPKMSIAVLPFEATGVQHYEAVSLSKRLHSGLVQTGQFRVLEIEKVDDLLHEMGLRQQTGTCTEEECVVQVGNLLGARWMATGSVGLVGKTYTVDVRVIDVESRHVMLSITRDYRGEIDGLLNLMQQIANELATRTEAKLRSGGLELSSEPTGAFVCLNAELKGRTPLLLDDVPIGEYAVSFKLDGYAESKLSVIVEPLKQKALTAMLCKQWLLQVESTPTEAKLYIANKYLGLTPFSRTIPAGNYKLKIQKDNYLTWETVLQLSSDKQVQATLELDRVALKQRYQKQQAPDREIVTIAPTKRHGWWWALGGAALIGGGIAAYVLTQDKDSGSGDVIGTPPEPPGK
jgi:TolB-like protein